MLAAVTRCFHGSPPDRSWRNSGEQCFSLPGIAHHKRNPTAPSPPVEQRRCIPARLQTPQIAAVFPRLVDHDDGHRAIDGTGGAKPHIVVPCLPRVLPPRPDFALGHVTPFDQSSISQGKERGRFALDQQGALMRMAHRLHVLRVAQPPLGHHQRRGRATPRRAAAEPQGTRRAGAAPTAVCPGTVSQVPADRAGAWQNRLARPTAHYQ
jgi:hypothetical protein